MTAADPGPPTDGGPSNGSDTSDATGKVGRSISDDILWFGMVVAVVGFAGMVAYGLLDGGGLSYFGVDPTLGVGFSGSVVLFGVLVMTVVFVGRLLRRGKRRLPVRIRDGRDGE